MPASSYIRQRALRHALLGAASVAMVLFVYVNVPTDFILRRWSLATAYVSLAFLAISLLIGPWNVLRARANPVSIDLRRDVGIWAGVLAIVHSVMGLFIHKMGGPWRYFFFGPDEPHRVLTTLPQQFEILDDPEDEETVPRGTSADDDRPGASN